MVTQNFYLLHNVILIIYCTCLLVYSFLYCTFKNFNTFNILNDYLFKQIIIRLYKSIKLIDFI